MNKFIAILLLPLLFSACGSMPTDSTAFKQRYDAGMAELHKANYDAAISAFQALRDQSSSPQQLAQAEFALAFTDYTRGEFTETVRRCETFIRQNTGYANIEYAYYLRAKATMALGDKQLLEILQRLPPNGAYPDMLREAYNQFAELVRRFPKTMYAEDAVRQMNTIRKKLAEYELNIVRFDLMEERYAEAVRRTKYVIEYYSDTPAHMNALELLVRSYKAQGKTKHAEATKRTLLQLQEAEGSALRP